LNTVAMSVRITERYLLTDRSSERARAAWSGFRVRAVTSVTLRPAASVLRSPPMEAATWTAIGVLAATSLGTLFYLGQRIDALGGRMDARIDALGARIDALSARIDTFEARVDARFDNLEARLDTHLERHAG
jgi:hypothetical protein